MRTKFDEFSKDMLGEVMQRGGPVDREYHVVGPGLDIDLWFRPDPKRIGALASAGLLGRVAALGPCMLEPYRNTPALPEMESCVCKQYILHHGRVVKARRDRHPRPTIPNLWILSSGHPGTIIREYHFKPMAGWPRGCYSSIITCERRHLIVLRQLPTTRDTLLLRLLGRGPTFRQAIAQLEALPRDAWERQVALPRLLAFRLQIPQNSKDKDMQDFMAQTQRLYAEWEQRIRNESMEAGMEAGQRALVTELLDKRFGPLQPDVVARVKNADVVTLKSWAERLLSAETLDDVLGG